MCRICALDEGEVKTIPGFCQREPDGPAQQKLKNRKLQMRKAKSQADRFTADSLRVRNLGTRRTQASLVRIRERIQGWRARKGPDVCNWRTDSCIAASLRLGSSPLQLMFEDPYHRRRPESLSYTILAESTAALNRSRSASDFHRPRSTRVQIASTVSARNNASARLTYRWPPRTT